MEGNLRGFAHHARNRLEPRPKTDEIILNYLLIVRITLLLAIASAALSMPIAAQPAGLVVSVAVSVNDALEEIAGLYRAATGVAVGVETIPTPIEERTGTASTPAAEQRAPVVAAASDLNFALTELADQFAAETHQRVQLVFGSSGTLARQIRDGAPFEMFMSADEAFPDQLAEAGLARDRGTVYAIGRIVLFAPTNSRLKPEEGLDGLARLIAGAGARVGKFAIANPEHAPYGRAAESALRKRGIWNQLQPRLVIGENVSQAAQFATTGDAIGGIIAYSIALSPGLQKRGTYAMISEADHAPLRQRMVLLSRATPAAGRFYRYLQEPEARVTFERFGFRLPK